MSDHLLLMTEKQEKILLAALELFAKEGYNATSTSKVAKAAGVSEGLIFKHFKNKEGLLKALIQEGQERMKALFVDVVMESDPKEVIRKALELPFQVDPNEYGFWKLQFKLKWEMEHHYYNKMAPMRMALTNAFTQLKYEKPALEAQVVEYLLEATSSAMLKQQLSNPEELRSFLREKYQV